MKLFIGALVLAVIAGGGYYLYSHTMKGGIPMPESGSMADPAISWQFKDAGERESIPYTKVSLTFNGKTQEVGDFQGSCSEIGASGGVDGGGLLAGELSAVQCWFAGGGDEIGVFAIEDGGYELLIGKLGEPTAETAGFRGDFEIRSEFK